MIYIVIPTTKQRRERLKKVIDALRESDVPHTICIYENLDGGYVKAVHNALEGIDGIVWILNDDMVPKPDCLKFLWNAYRQSFAENDGIAQPFEQFHGGNLAVCPFGHSKVLKQYMHQGYKHHYVDTELTLVMKQKGKYLEVPEAFVDHQHYIADSSLLDETYNLTRGGYKEDEALFIKRKSNNFR